MAARRLVLALDLGTSAVKAALVDADRGTVSGSGREAYPTRTLPGGGAEQDPAAWLAAACTACEQCFASAGITARRTGDAEIIALGLTGQMQDVVLLGAHPVPALAPAILYSDVRAAGDAQALGGLLPRWEAIAGNEQDATSCAATLRRLAREEPDLLARTERVVFGPAGYLAAALGCGAWCDLTTASTTGLLDLSARAWSADVAGALGRPLDLLPDLAQAVPPTRPEGRVGRRGAPAGSGAPERTGSSGALVGRTDERAAGLLGLPRGIPVVLAPGDAAATTLGAVGLQPGAGYVYLGTSGWVAEVTPAGAAGREGASHRLALPDARARLEISAVLAAGGAADWARAAFLDGASPARADALLAERESSRGRGPSGLLALPSIRGERFPVRDAAARGAVIGMDAATRGIDLYAAVLEGVALALSHALEPGTGGTLPVAGGGAASGPWLRILADVTGRPVRRIGTEDAAVRGAALAAAGAVGADGALAAPPAPGGGGRALIAPAERAHAAYAEHRRAHRALYGALAGLGAGA